MQRCATNSPLILTEQWRASEESRETCWEVGHTLPLLRAAKHRRGRLAPGTDGRACWLWAWCPVPPAPAPRSLSPTHDLGVQRVHKGKNKASVLSILTGRRFVIVRKILCLTRKTQIYAVTNVFRAFITITLICVVFFQHHRL